MTSKLKSRILKLFQINGLILRSEASRHLLEILSSIEESSHTEWLEKIIEIVQKQPLESGFVNKECLEAAIKECLDATDNGQENMLTVIDAFSIPALVYDLEKKKFFPRMLSGLSAPSLYGNAEAKANIFIERYRIVHQRTINHQLFTPPVFADHMSSTSQSFSLKPVDYLLGTTAKQGNLIVLGMLTQLKEGRYYLEDPTGAIQLNLSNTVYKGGLFTENCFVLAEGHCEDGVFHVSALGFPPPEPARITLEKYSGVNFFGEGISKNVNLAKLKALEENQQDAMFVILSDVWLDKIKVMQKLRILFAGYSEMPPTCFILMGNFVSSPAGFSHFQAIKDGFKNLASLIAEFPSLVENSHFIFVPGPSDPVLSHIFPRPPIPDSLLDDFKKKVKKAVFTSNPCRLRFYTQRIVIFREDLIAKMCRNSVYFPWEHEEDVDIPNLFAKTLIANAHLCPLPQVVQPIYWELDHALRLYPLPDLVICGDKYDPYCVSSADCTFLNPGSFPRSNFAFKVYLPASKQVEDSQIMEIPS